MGKIELYAVIIILMALLIIAIYIYRSLK